MKNNKGITLIALVITIIVILILSGITLTMVLGDNGILNKSQQAKRTNDYMKVKEEVLFNWNEIQIQSLGNSNKLSNKEAINLLKTKLEENRRRL